MTRGLAMGRLLLNTSFWHTIRELGHGQNSTLMKCRRIRKWKELTIFLPKTQRNALQTETRGLGKTPLTRAFGGKHPKSPTSDGEEDGPILGSMEHNGGAEVGREEVRCVWGAASHACTSSRVPANPARGTQERK